MPRLVLIVDDFWSNRQILKKILGDEYRILEAANGREAVAVMEREYKTLSLVLLDLGMPVMDGFEVLSYMQQSEALSQIPVIVTTGQTDTDSEEKALHLGAKDYISKPYKAVIIQQRIRNTIKLRETAATVNALQRDRLTGLYSREAFFDKVAELTGAHEPGYYMIAAFDVDRFKVINDQYGTAKGDEVLRHIAHVFESGFAPYGGICCRITSDNFATLYPASFADSAEIAEIRRQAASAPGLPAPLTFSIGRYRIADLSLSPSAMYDRATLAENSVKGRYDRNIAQYDESMRDHLLFEQRIVTQMKGALKERQFEAWFQPQYNHSTGALIGAEALARWRHPEEGIIPPGAFIPIFEKNGFVYELDKFIWQETCRYLQKWIKEGRAPLPVSVNISRYDIFRPDLVDALTGMIERFQIPTELLRLEITESAFAESAEGVVGVVRQLIERGFTVEIDDFGSGYSSLNTLKSVPAQVVKLDMRFLEDEDGSQRGGNILESIVRMTKWLGMSVIAEGVEEQQQADFLKSIGCSYVQGYLYAKPMPAAEYEVFCKGARKEERLLTIETVENLDNNAFWNPKSMDTLIFNSYVGAACIFEYHDRNVELLRANDKYAALLGGGALSTEEVLRMDWLACLTPEGRTEVRKVLQRSGETGEELTREYVFKDIPGGPEKTYLRATMRVIASVGARQLVYCMCENITAQRQAEQGERRLVRLLKAIMDNVNCGITAVTVEGDTVTYLFANDRYFELLGYTRAQYAAEIGSAAFSTVHPADVARVQEVVEHTIATGRPGEMEFRAIRRDGAFIWLRCNVSMADFEGVRERVQLTTYVDFTSEKLAAQELLDNLPDGAALYEYDGTALMPVHLNKRYWELVNRAPVGYMDRPVSVAIHPDDREAIAQELQNAIRENRDVVCDVRLRYGTEGYRAFHAVGRITPKADGKYAVYATYTPISDEAVSIREMLPIALREMMDTQSGFSFVKDRNRRYVCCSRALYEAAGLCSEAEIIGKTDDEILDRETAVKYAADDRRVMESGESLLDRIEILPGKDGQERYASTSKFPLKDSKGNVVGIYGVGRDITEAREMESQLALLTNSVPGGIAIYEAPPDTPQKIRLVYFSDGFSRILGYEREEYAKLAAKDPFCLIVREDLPAVMAQTVDIMREKPNMDCVFRITAKDGGIRWINLKAVTGEPHGGNITVNAVLFDVTERQEAVERLRVSEEESRLAIEHSKNVVCRYDVAAKTLTVSPGVNPIFGIGAKLTDVPGGQVRTGQISKETVDAYTAFYEGIRRGEKNGDVVFQRKSTSGWRWIEAHHSTIFSSGGKPVSAVISFTDVTDRFEKEAVYKRWQQSIRQKDPKSYSLFRCVVSKETVLSATEGELLTVRFAPGAFQFDEHTAQYVAEYVLEEDGKAVSAFLSIDTLLLDYYHGDRIRTLDYREKRPEGGYCWIRLTVDLAEAPRAGEVEAYLLFEDVDAAKRTELLTIERAETDSLTGVLNRATFAERVEQRLREAAPNTRCALLMLDIDGFKQVNDAFGHAVGDQALMDVTEALHAALRREDLVGRLGGDEFAAFLADIPNDAIAASKAQQICALTRKSLSVEVEISGSIGIAVSPRDGEDFDTLYKRADSALYYVKGSGKDNYAFYHEEMADETLSLESDADKSRGKRRRMLIVDDSSIDHALLSNIFADEFILEKAKDGNAALIRLRHYGAAISVVLLDLMMPGMDGFAVLKRMQASAELRTIPVVVVSGDGNRETSLQAIRAGASDYVSKPVDPDVLRIRVHSAIAKAENERLRAKNSFLEYQGSEVQRYRTVVERSGVALIEHDWIAGTFAYEPSVSEHIAGNFDDRKLWYILLTDLVANTDTVRRMQELVHRMAADREISDASLFVQLKTPSKARHWFRMDAYKVINEFGLTGKIYLVFTDLGTERPPDPEAGETD